MTDQELFTKVATHLMAQGARAMDEGVGLIRFGLQCKYLAEDGKQCAAGCLIPKSKYRKEMEREGSLPNNPLVQKCLKSEGIKVKQFDLVFRLQNIHDIFPPDEWEHQLFCMAQKEGWAWR